MCLYETRNTCIIQSTRPGCCIDDRERSKGITSSQGVIGTGRECELANSPAARIKLSKTTESSRPIQNKWLLWAGCRSPCGQGFVLCVDTPPVTPGRKPGTPRTESSLVKYNTELDKVLANHCLILYLLCLLVFVIYIYIHIYIYMSISLSLSLSIYIYISTYI